MSNRLLIAVVSLLLFQSAAIAESSWHAGFSKIDITPGEPVRLSGYGNRATPHVGIDTPLFVRCLALTNQDPQQTSGIHLLLSIDTIGMPATLSKQITDHAHQAHGIPRSQIVLSATHTHTGPHLAGGLSNLYAEPLSDSEIEASLRYRDTFMAAIQESIRQAIETLQPARLEYGQGEVDFAVNRRILSNSKWTGFGNQTEGPVDHSVGVVKISSSDGDVLGTLFNYACHCTSINPEINRVNADWAGYAATHVERHFKDAVALCTIGCAGDANPEPRGTTGMAMVHGLELGNEIIRVLENKLTPLTKNIDARFDYASLEFELPTLEELRAQVNNANPQTKRRAEHWIEVYKDEGRLPATYPVPIQSWIFGDELTIVFIGGEVVIDYANRLRKQFPDRKLWVTAYTNDVMGYLCSERMRSEGGYEFDQSTVFYNLPGPWASGTEDKMIERVTNLIVSGGRPQPDPAEQTLGNFKLTEGYRIELVAAEPLVVDPINIAFGNDGRLWVVEMGDYPEGDQSKPGGSGNIKVLSDQDGDGRFDKATTFISGLEFPTGVFPWRNGVIVACAPDVFYAEDLDGDDVADRREVIYSGFGLANPQHRINGFTYALDHSLHLASGDTLGELLCNQTGERFDAAGHDVQIFPDSGTMNLVNGRSQYIRSRNAWGEWFGSDNPRPSYHYVIDEHYAALNPHISYSRNAQQLFDPPLAAPVYPANQASERFNDLYAANRFTSACSSIIVGKPFGNDQYDAVIVCEPVHQMVHRSFLVPDGATYKAVRGDKEQASELLASSDPWFRPVRVIEGPDNCLWVVDMYRESIEHPEWIPESWKQQLDLRAGSDRGRIYRIVPESVEAKPLAEVATTEDRSVEQLLNQLEDNNRTRRELAHQRLVELCDKNGWDTVLAKLELLLNESDRPETRVHAIHLLAKAKKLKPSHVQTLLHSGHFGCQIVALGLAESMLNEDADLQQSVCELSNSPDARVRMRVALVLAQNDDENASRAIGNVCEAGTLDFWTATAITVGLPKHGLAVADLLSDRLLAGEREFTEIDEQLLRAAFTTFAATGVDVAKYVGEAIENKDSAAAFRLASIFATSQEDFAARSFPRESPPIEQNSLLASLYEKAIPLISNQDIELEQRCRAMTLVGIGLGSNERESELLFDLLAPETPLEIQYLALDRIAKIDRLAVADNSMFTERIFADWDSLSSQIRDASISYFLTRGNWQQDLIEALETNVVRVNDLSPTVRQQLRLTGSRSLQVRADRVLGSSKTSKRELVQSYLSEMHDTAELASGAALFKQHCAVCHQAPAGETAVGASLENLTNRSRQHLVESILDPNYAVDPKYQTYMIETVDGRVLSGVIEEESSDRIILGHADGKRTIIRRDEIASLKNSGISLMPEGFEQNLTPLQMADLILFVEKGL